MCIISTGFPLGYHIMSAIIFSSIEHHGWQSAKRRISILEFVATVIIGPIFTTKYLPNESIEYSPTTRTTKQSSNRKIYFSLPIITWMVGIFTTISAVNNFLLHLVSFFILIFELILRSQKNF